MNANQSPVTRLVLAFSFTALSTLLAAQAQAAVYQCSMPRLRGNDFVCREYPNLCNFTFIVDEGSKKISRRDAASGKLVPVVMDKWEDQRIIAHEDQTRIDSRFVEQFFYKIEIDSGKFLFANEYVTGKGRYLTQEDINLADKKTFGYYRPKLFSEHGRCTFKTRE